MIETTTTTGSVNTGLTGNNYAFGQAAAGYLSYPAAAIGTQMQTSRNSAVRGLGAGISTVGTGLLSRGSNLFKGAQGVGFGMGAAGAVLNAAAGPKQEYSGYKGGTTQALDTAYDAISAGVQFIPGVGQILGGAMQLGKGLGAVANKLGAGTDAMTDVDSVLGSNFFNLTPIGLINGFGGKKSKTMGGQDFMTQSALDNQWAGYGGTYKDYNYASSKAGKKYGLFSSGARKRANQIINKANMDRETLLDVNRESELGNIRGNMMADINGARYNQALYGGYNANLLRVGKYGFKIQDIQRAKRLNSKLIKKVSEVDDVVDSFQKGGKSEKQIPSEASIRAPQSQPSDLIKLIYNSDANFAKRLIDPHRKVLDLGNGEIGTHKLAWSEDEEGVMIYPEIQEINGQLVDLSENRDKAWESAIKNKDYIIFPSREDADWFTVNYKKYFPSFQNYVSPTFKEGGSMNIIPEGSLHARLHHMDNADNLTKKGIPVVDNDGNQQAEIELNEIIFRKEVTDKLEKLAKDGSDEAAIEAGKLLVEEILNNTDDRTGLIDTIEIAKNGTKLTPKLQSGNILTPSQSHLDSLQNIVTDINSKNFQNFLDKNNKLKAVQSIGNSVFDAFSDLSKASEQRKAAKQLQENQLDGQLQWFKWIEQLKLMANADVAAQEERDNRDRAKLYELRSQV